MPPVLPVPGLYRHYKGALYLLFGTAIHSETGEWMAVYYGQKDFQMWTRPLSMFNETIRLPDGSTTTRFSYVGPGPNT